MNESPDTRKEVPMACTSEIRGRADAASSPCGRCAARQRDGASYQIEVPARIDAVGPLCAFLTVLGQRHGMNPEDLHSVEISAYETCLNIIEHAYGFDPSGRITVRIRFADRRLVLAFYDHGKGIDPKKVPPPDIADPRVRLRGRGFGLEIVRRSVDRMRYRQTRHGENSLLLVKVLSGRSGSDRASGPFEWEAGGAA
jgi:serine/threonine-protein kinase RsbW